MEWYSNSQNVGIGNSIDKAANGVEWGKATSEVVDNSSDCGASGHVENGTGC